VRALATLAILLVAAGAEAQAPLQVRRLHWRGIASDGTPPPKLDKLSATHLAIALKPLDVELVVGPPFDAEASARCAFPSPARCLVEVVQSSGTGRAERRAEIPFRDADDLSESLAVLVADLLQNDLREIVTPPPPPEPPPEPPKPKPPELKPEPPPQPQKPTRVIAVRKGPPPPPSRMVLALSPTVAVGFTGEPVLAGARLDGLYAGGRGLRAGGTLSVAGGSQHRGDYDLAFVRTLIAARIGGGVWRGRVDFDATAGPALLLISTDAHVANGTHTLATFAVVAGVRLGVAVARTVAIHFMVDAAVAVSTESVREGMTSLADFGIASLEAAIGISWIP
jgi:hypothetical protein